jgi:hypothetical protein
VEAQHLRSLDCAGNLFQVHRQLVVQLQSSSAFEVAGILLEVVPKLVISRVLKK